VQKLRVQAAGALDYAHRQGVIHRDGHPVVTDLHAVNSSLESNGFGELLLCTLINFVSAAPGPTKTLAIVYLYKQGTFYPFAPRPGTSNQRDNATELAIRPMLAQDLPVEPELSRWLAVWGAPGL